MAETTERRTCATGCGRVTYAPNGDLCGPCLNDWLDSPEALRAKAVDAQRADVAFFDFCTRRALERRNEAPVVSQRTCARPGCRFPAESARWFCTVHSGRPPPAEPGQVRLQVRIGQHFQRPKEEP
jgi:hypothetical protein